MSVIINGDTGIDKITDGSVVQADLASGVATTGPSFSAYSNTLTSLPNATYTKVIFNIEDYDTDSCFDTSTYRFTPTVEGYYQINGVVVTTAAASGLSVLALYKNGSVFHFGSGATLVNGPLLVLSGLVYLNGSTDYVELFAYQASGSTRNVGSNQPRLKFQGYLARKA